MSVMEENVIAPWMGPACFKNSLTIVVLSTNLEIMNRISQALREVHNKGNFQWKLLILQSFELEEIVIQSDSTERIAIDFVIIGVDTSKITCLDWAKTVYGQVHPDLRSRRVVLVNARGLPANGMAVSANELISLQKDSNLDILTSNVYKQDDANSLARRLLKYIEVSVGVKTGLPNLNV